MKAPSSTHIATQIKQSILKRALATISRRQVLFKNMNLYSLGQVQKVIQQISHQQSLKINQTKIAQTNDHINNPYDNMMSMSQVQLMQNYTEMTQCNTHQNQSNKNNSNKKFHVANTHHKDKLSIIDLLQEDQGSRDYLTTCYSISKEEKNQQSPEIQAFRLIKQNQYQQMLIKQQSQQKKRPPIPINLNNERVMYGYDSKVIKLQKMKEKHLNIAQMHSSLITLDDIPAKNKQKGDLFYNKPPIYIKNKINITQKQAEYQKQKQKQKQLRAKRTYKTLATEQQPPTINIRVNPQSHKQIQQAITIKQAGIKISIDKRQFSADRYSTTNRINRKITRSEYLQIKSNQQVKHAYYRQNNIENVKIKNQERLKTDYVKQSKSSNHYNSGKRYKISPNRFYQPKQDKSKIFIHNQQAKAQLLIHTKQKPFLFQTIQNNPSQNKQLSHVDRYNLLYVQYKGNPPHQKLLNTLQSQSKMLRQGKQALLAYSKSISRENRLIKKIS